jgi:hypothetical protein
MGIISYQESNYLTIGTKYDLLKASASRSLGITTTTITTTTTTTNNNNNNNNNKIV